MKLKNVFLFWLPLYASWLLMLSEGPLLAAMVNRLADEVTMLAAFGIALSLAVTIESPVINLLATSTALVRDRASYLQMRRFTVHCIVVLTALATLVAFTQVFDWLVVDLLRVPMEIAGPVQLGLQILTPWTAAIAWRRFLQGILIRHGLTQVMARGTAIRLFFTLGAGWIGGWVLGLPGIAVAASALLVGVTVEAAYAHWAAAPVLRQLPERDDPSRPALDYRTLFHFHLPLAATSVLALMAQPLVTWALARLANPAVSLAAWPLVFQTSLVLRAPALALPEVIITLADRDGALDSLRRFVMLLAAAVSAFMAILVFSPLLEAYLVDLQDAAPAVAASARLGLALLLPLPALSLWSSWQRGLLIYAHRTRVVNEAMVVLMFSLTALLFLAVFLEAPGLASAAVALQTSIFIQGIYVHLRARAAFAGARLHALDDGISTGA